MAHFTAKFDTECNRCHGPIKRGDTGITWSRTGQKGLYHIACKGKHAPTPVLAPLVVSEEPWDDSNPYTGVKLEPDDEPTECGHCDTCPGLEFGAFKLECTDCMDRASRRARPHKPTHEERIERREMILRDTLRESILSGKLCRPEAWDQYTRGALRAALDGTTRKEGLKLERYWRGILAGMALLGLTKPEYESFKGKVTIMEPEFDWVGFFNPKPVNEASQIVEHKPLKEVTDPEHLEFTKVWDTADKCETCGNPLEPVYGCQCECAK